jgi:hypothetical protein
VTTVARDVAALANLARPRLWLAGALLGITLFGRHEPAHREPVRVAFAPPALVLQLQPNSDFVTIDAVPRDPMNSGVGPLAAWISQLLQSLL